MELKSDVIGCTGDAVEHAQEGGAQGCTTAVPMYDAIRMEQKIVNDVTSKLYNGPEKQNEDEGAENYGEYEMSWFNRKKRKKNTNHDDTSLCWRRGKKVLPVAPRPVVSYTGDSTKDIFWFRKKRERNTLGENNDVKQMRYCPGDQCRVSFPVYQFSKNVNVYPDGLDRYCVQCNYRRKQELSLKRKRARLWGTCAVDSLEEFKMKKNRKTQTRTKIDWHTHIKDMVLRKIELSLQDYRKSNTQTIVPLTAEIVFSSLFGGRLFHCTHTGKRMTKKCFLDHHSVSFHTNPGRVDVCCSGCSIPECGSVKAFVFS